MYKAGVLVAKEHSGSGAAATVTWKTLKCRVLFTLCCLGEKWNVLVAPIITKVTGDVTAIDVDFMLSLFDAEMWGRPLLQGRVRSRRPLHSQPPSVIRGVTTIRHNSATKQAFREPATTGSINLIVHTALLEEYSYKWVTKES